VSQVAVQFENVQKTYDGKTLVIKNLDLEISRGEFLTMLGPSGSGKTTCLMMLAGFEAPTHGAIIMDGVSLNAVPPHKRNIGIVFQNYALFPHMTVEENVAYPLRIRKLPKAEIKQRVTRALEMIELGGLGTRRPRQLSGGQQQRVALARALVFNPKVILMDEPLGALDKNLRDQMQYEIKHIHEKLGVTIVYVTHDQSEALVMSDRIAVFNDGMIQQISTPSDLYEQPQNTFVAQFIGENNRLTGKVSDIDGQLCWVDLDGGAKVKALAVNVKSRGSATSLMLRPERVMLNPVEMECPNIFEARVEEVVYIGKYLRARLFVCGTDQFIVMLPNSSDRRQLKRGEIVNVGWRANDCRALEPS